MSIEIFIGQMSKLNQAAIDGIRKSLVQAGAGVPLALAPFICFYVFQMSTKLHGIRDSGDHKQRHNKNS